MWLHVRNSEGTVTGAALAPGSLLVGRDATSDVFIADERASRQHSRLTTSADGTVRVEDLGSTNGTWVNGVRITEPTVVGEGDEIRVGSHLLQLTAGPLDDGAPPPQATVPATFPGGTPAPVWPAPARAAPAPAGWGSPAAARPDTPTPAHVAGPPGGPSAVGPPPVPAGAPPGGRSGRRLAVLLGGIGAGVVVIALVVVLLVTQLGGAATMTAGQISARWGPSTLYVLVSDQGHPVDSGSGWVYDASQGLIVTNAHVVDGGTQFSVGQGAMKRSATLVAVAPCQDLAVLRIGSAKGLHTFHLGSQSAVHGGDSVTALGYPEGSTETPSLATTTGVVSIPSTSFQQPDAVDVPAYPDVVQVTAPINPGNSGGPLLDDQGRLIGVNTAGLSQDQNGQTIQNENFAIGVDQVKKVVPGLAGGHSQGYTGMDLLFPTQASDFDEAGVPAVQGGVIVPDAVAGSPAARAGFGKFGNASVITAINGQPLDGSLAGYCKAVGGLTTGQTASFHVVLSDGGEADVTVPFE
jgi:S1-C subfamily serine protease